ncbi:GntR family transcriptional regulator [Brevibacillus sp. B_LB10_24]|uniref:GntR family transcriptional regulator n=1 Tax=Brevibacillus sp. B_LB10_24 TaxID=3380645 RepID=UPI0038B77788
MDLKHSIAKSSMRYRIANEIRKLIFQGNLRPGDKLTETQLASDLGVSRGPIREAIQQLEMEGYVISTPYKETKVAAISEEEVVELLIPMRRNMETYALKKGLHLWNEQTYDTLASIIQEMKKGVILQELYMIVELDLQFHQVIIESSGMGSITTVWETIMNRIRLHYAYQHLEQQYPDQYLAEFVEPHERLLQVCRTGDLNKAIQALKEHIDLMIHP